MSSGEKKSLGQSIDELIAALEDLDEGSRSTAIRAACEHLGIQLELPPSRQGPAAQDLNTTQDPMPQQPRSPALDIRSLKEQKQPKTAVEMACVVAYYLDTTATVEERKPTVTKADLDKYFKQAGFRLPKRMEQVLVDAKNGGYFDSAGRGSYKLNPVGHNLVVHSLPRAKG